MVKYKKKKISSKLRQLVWNYHIDETIGKSKCLCCNETDISCFNFECGHIKSERNGGKTEINNLLPICSLCNRSMGTQHLFEFKKSLENDTNYLSFFFSGLGVMGGYYLLSAVIYPYLFVEEEQSYFDYFRSLIAGSVDRQQQSNEFDFFGLFD
jgi:hypothetical protein